MGHMAEAIMTKSFVNPRARKYFKEKEEVCAFLVICFLENYSKVWVWLIKMLKYEWFSWERERLKTFNLAPSKQMRRFLKPHFFLSVFVWMALKSPSLESGFKKVRICKSASRNRKTRICEFAHRNDIFENALWSGLRPCPDEAGEQNTRFQKCPD